MPNVKINLKKHFLGLDGKPLKNEEDVSQNALLSKIAARALAFTTEGDSLLFSEWAKDLYKDGVIEISNTEFQRFKRFFNETRSLTNFAIDQIMAILNKVDKELIKRKETDGTPTSPR